MNDKIRVRILVSGIVQGVFFRDTLRKKAVSLGLTGWARNLPDGKLEAVAEGDKVLVEELIDFARQGPPLARVEKVEVGQEAYKGEFSGFEIR